MDAAVPIRALVVTALLAAALPGAAGDEPWTAKEIGLALPATFEGDLAFEVHVHFPTTATCTLDWTARGTRVEGPQLSVYESWGNDGHFRLHHEAAAHAHADGVADTRDHLDATGRWGWSRAYEDTYAGDQVLQFVAANLGGAALEPGELPLEFEFACDEEFTIASLEGGRNVLQALQSGMQGGVGATAVVGPAVQHHNVLEGTFTDDRVWVYATASQFGVHEVVIDHPDGSRTWTHADGVELEFDGGPGAWRFDVTRAAVKGPPPGPSGGHFALIAVGLSPLERLGDVAAAPAGA